jgi:hypothetical protein
VIMSVVRGADASIGGKFDATFGACQGIFDRFYIPRDAIFTIRLNWHSLVICSAKMVTGAQIRGARALIGWSATTLAQRSGVSYPTIQRAESVDGILRLQAPNLAAIQRTLEDAGIVFLDNRELRDGGPGVRLALETKL